MALRAGSVGLGREAGLGARRGWTRRRRHPHARGTPGRARPRGPPPPHPARLPPPAPPSPVSSRPPASHLRGGRVGGRRDGCRGEGRERPGPRWRGGVPRGVPRAHGGPGTRGAGGGGDSGREPGPSRGSPQLRRASRPPSGSPAGAGAPPAARARARVRGRGAVRACRAAPPPRLLSPPRRARARRVPARRSPPPGAPPGPRFRAAPRLGRRLAADLELVRTRGIRLFN